MKTLQKSGLKNLVALSENVKIYIPSTMNIDEKTDNSFHVETVQNALNACFGGSTMFTGVGSYFSENLQKTVIEEVTIVQAFTSELNNEKIDSVLHIARTLCKDMKQECVSIEVNNVLYFVEETEPIEPDGKCFFCEKVIKTDFEKMQASCFDCFDERMKSFEKEIEGGAF